MPTPPVHIQYERIRCLFRHLIDKPRNLWIVHIVDVDDRKSCFDIFRQAGDATGIRHSKLNGHIAHIKRFLRQNQANDAFAQLLNCELRCVIGYDLNRPLETGIYNGCTRTLGAKYVGAKDTGKIRNAFATLPVSAARPCSCRSGYSPCQQL